MTETGGPESAYPVADVRRKRRLPLIWVVPLVAVVVGLVLAVQAVLSTGPLITITFDSATGLVAGETEVRFKDVAVGLVEEIRLSDDLKSVEVKARMDRSIRPYLLDTTRFWIETARISAGEISGLGTLLSGAYIGMDPGSGTRSQREFTGSSTPPVITTGLAGRHFLLEAETLGSVTVKTPVYYRQIKVGEVVKVGLREDGAGVRTRIFVKAPYDRYVKTSSRFWNASGVDFKLDASGVKVNTESLTSLLYGGIAFETPVGFEEESLAEEGHLFPLFRNHAESKEERYFKRDYYFVHFPHTIRGLQPGAAVEFLGFKVGEVVDMKLELDADQQKFLAPVLIYVEPERIEVQGEATFDSRTFMEKMVSDGLRVKLQPANLLTGQLYIDLVIDRKADKAAVDYSLAHPLLPSVPSDVQALTADIQEVVNDLQQVEFGQLSAEVRSTLALMRRNLDKTDRMFDRFNNQTADKVETTVEEMSATLVELRRSLGSDSDLNSDTRKALAELTDAARSVKVLTDYLAEHPEAILRGKDESE